MSQEELYILLMEQTLRNARDHEARCRRRFHDARENLIQAQDSVEKLSAEIEGFRNEWLKRRCV